jgi:large subunit ribosomal protein L18
MLNKIVKKIKRKKRIRSVVIGSALRPRLAVSSSNKHIIAQLIDDSVGKTLVYVSDEKLKAIGTKTQKAKKVGETIAEEAKKIKVTNVVFDRGGKLYHGRVKALADGAREKGLNF